MIPPHRILGSALLHRWFLLVVAAVLCACSAAPSRALMMHGVSFPLRDMRFPSGLRVIVEEDHRAPVVGVFLLVGSGSTSDPPGKEGLAHYVEHLAFHARPDGKTTLWSLLERSGAAAWNASTGLDSTIFWETGPKEALEPLVALEGVRLFAPVANVTPETAAGEREVLRSELRQRNETGIYGSILSYAQAAVFPAGHPYARPVIGSHESLSSTTLEDVQRFAKERYRPDNATLVIVGDVDLQTVGGIIEHSLPVELRSGTPGRAPPPRLDPVAPEPPAPPPAAPLARYQEGVATPELWIGWSLPRSFDTEGYLDHFVAIAAQEALDGPFDHDGSIGGVQVRLIPGKQAAMLLCRVVLLDATNPEKSLDHVLSRLVEVWDWDTKVNPVPVGPPGARGNRFGGVLGRFPARGYQAYHFGFERMQRSAVTAMLIDAESLVDRGHERAELTHFTGDPTTYAHALQGVMEVGAARVTGFAYKYLTRERARTVLVTPLPGTATPPLVAEVARSVPLDDEPPSFGADAIRRYVHAPGIGAYRDVVLDNGLEVIIGRRAGLPLVTVGLSLHGGSAAAAPPAADEVAQRLARPNVSGDLHPADFGGHLGSQSDRDDLSYTFVGAAGNVANMLEMLAQRAPAMRVESGDVVSFDREIVPVLAKMDLAPEARAGRAFREALYGGHPYGRTLAAEDLARVSAGDATGWLERTAVPRNAVLAIVGEIDPAEVEGLVRGTFGRWSRAEPAQAPPAPPVLPARLPKPNAIVSHRPGATQGQIEIGCLLPPPGASRARYDVMASILRDRLTDALRRSLGATYGFHAGVSTYRGGAADLVLEGVVDNGRVANALATVRRTFILLEQGHFKDGEVEVARWRAARAYGVRWSTNASVVDAILAARNEARDLRSLDAYPEDLIAVTPEALQADFARCAAAPVLSLVGDEATLRAALAQVWP